MANKKREKGSARRVLPCRAYVAFQLVCARPAHTGAAAKAEPLAWRHRRLAETICMRMQFITLYARVKSNISLKSSRVCPHAPFECVSRRSRVDLSGERQEAKTPESFLYVSSQKRSSAKLLYFIYTLGCVKQQSWWGRSEPGNAWKRIQKVHGNTLLT